MHSPSAHDGAYKIKLLTRATIGGTRWRAGAYITVPGDKLRVAAHLVRCGTARPADPATARDVALFEALRALPES